MRFYNRQHQFYCGIDLHARSMYLCVRDQAGSVVLHQNLVAGPHSFLTAIKPYRADLVVGCECMFAWYWVADLCAEHNIPFVLGHAPYLKAVHGGKTKNDKLDADTLSALLRGGNFPERRSPIGLSASTFLTALAWIGQASRARVFETTTSDCEESR